MIGLQELVQRVERRNNFNGHVDGDDGLRWLQRIRHYYIMSMQPDPEVWKIVNDCIDLIICRPAEWGPSVSYRR